MIRQDRSERRHQAAATPPGGTAGGGPASRGHFLEQVGDVLITLTDDRTLAVMALDLNHFNELTVVRGDDVRELILVEVSERLQERLSADDVITLTTGDHFVLACEVANSPLDRQALQTRLLDCFDEPFLAATPPVFLSAHVGVAFSDGADDDPQQLLGSAEVGRADSQRGGDSAMVVFDPPARVQIREQFSVHQALHRALERHEMSLDYQPIVSLSTLETLGLEALLRWKPLDRDPIPPDAFIPWAEESGLIIPIGSWVLKEVARQWAGWTPTDGATAPSLTVNVSVVQLEKGIAALSEDLVEASASLPGRLSIEITESRLANDPEAASATIKRLRRLGVGVIIDDFGTGFSSLRYLQDFPVDALKIDRSFVEHIDTSDRDQAIVGTIIALAHTLGIFTIAEGVETQTQLKCLAELSCDSAQGYFLCRPTPFDRVRLAIEGSSDTEPMLRSR
jgi:EAL domain-containing protein (putative c-di-GMP-specific phosphodiesterase class I)/GGDEF domain-containing protein